MSRSQKRSGHCAKRNIQVNLLHVCDWYEPKRKGKYKVCCRNCVHFTNKEVPNDAKKEIENEI